MHATLPAPLLSRQQSRRQLTESQVLGVCDALPSAPQSGTGERSSGYAAIVRASSARGVKLSLTSNGTRSSAPPTKTTRGVSRAGGLHRFPTAAEQERFGSPALAARHAASSGPTLLGITVTVLSVMMKTNYRRLTRHARWRLSLGANYRVNVYQPVRRTPVTLSYDEFWDGFKAAPGETRLVQHHRADLNAMLGQPFTEGFGVWSPDRAGHAAGRCYPLASTGVPQTCA